MGKPVLPVSLPLRPNITYLGRMRHGGNLRAYAAMAGCAPSDILDFSASLNPLGPPEWLRRVIDRHVESLVHYPDPDCTRLVHAAAQRYGVEAGQLVCANGASELLAVLPEVSGCTRAVVPQPAYGEYARACELAGLRVELLPLRADAGFALEDQEWALLESLLASGPALVVLGQPNNPTGAALHTQRLRNLAMAHPQSLLVVDEAFADFIPGLDRLTVNRPRNVVTVASLTKTYAIPGLRLGLAMAEPALAERLRRRIPPWSVNTLAQAVGARALADADYLARTVELVAVWRRELHAGLAALPGVAVLPGQANFLLCRLPGGGSVQRLLAATLRRRVAIRPCAGFPGLDDGWFRVAVRQPGENARLLDALAAGLPEAVGIAGRHAVRAGSAARPPTPAIMVQGTASNAGKSLLVAALCRIFEQDGLNPAPFKSQNMSLNSAVTADGREIGRAQASQAAACRREADARMNPVLLKPSADKGSQVIVMGQPLANMSVGQYIAAKPRIWETVKQAYDDLAATAGVMVLEGAGSPAEVNLKAHDIVNMRMAAHAQARVLLAADIDRGGAYAGLLGTMGCLTEDERRMVGGYVLNKFRGDASLLAPANDWIAEATGREVLGVVPYLRDLGLPEEDSVSFKSGEAQAWRPRKAELDIAVVDLPHISNFSDFDALAAEADVAVRRVRSAQDLSGSLLEPDALILPGSKNTPADLAFLRQTGLADAIAAMAGATCILGICGGYQMLGQQFLDPLGIEAGAGSSHAGLGLLPVSTILEERKTLERTSGRHISSRLPVRGYQIHHGVTTLDQGAEALEIFLEDSAGQPLGWGNGQRRIWGTYLHGLFEADGFRRLFLDGLRAAKGLPPLVHPTAQRDIHAALDRLAQAVRAGLDMPRIYALIGR